MTSAFDEAAVRRWLVDYLVANNGCSPEHIDRGASMHLDAALQFEFDAGVESSKQIASSEIAGRREQVIDRGRKQ